MTSRRGPVLLAGLPRCGSTWAANVLSRSGSVRLVHEPDNDKQWLTAFIAKQSLGRFPLLEPGVESPSYAALWHAALVGSLAGTPTSRMRLATRLWSRQTVEQRELALRGRPSVLTRLAVGLAGSSAVRSMATATPPVRQNAEAVALVKTVHAPLAIEWVSDAFPAAQVVIMLRHPANVLSSWLSMSLPDRDRGLDRSVAVQERYLTPWSVPPPGADPVERAAWQVCLLTAALVDAAGRHPEWLVISHEQLCQDPAARFKALADALGLPFDDATLAFLRESDRPGDGFAIQRRASELPEAWRQRLDPHARRALARAIVTFPGLERWAGDLRTAPTLP